MKPVRCVDFSEVDFGFDKSSGRFGDECDLALAREVAVAAGEDLLSESRRRHLKSQWY